MGAIHPPPPPYRNNLYIITYVSNQVGLNANPPPVWRPCICPSSLIVFSPFSTYIYPLKMCLTTEYISHVYK